MTPDEEIAALKAENAALREQVQALVARVQELEGRVAKDSHNRSKLPSSDGLKRKPKSLRQKSGKTPGGQLGHRGRHLQLVAQPDMVIAHRPAACGACHAPLAPGAWEWVERRQVRELPPLRLTVTEHQIAHVRCTRCGATTRGQAAATVPAPVQYGPRLRALAVYVVQQQFLAYARVRELLAEVFGLVRQAGDHQQVQAVEGQIRRQLRRAPVLQHDETGLRVVDAAGAGAGLQWTHVTSTPQLTHYALPPPARGPGPRRHRHPAAVPRREHA